MSDVTQMLEAIWRGNSQSATDLLPLVYEELRKLAAHKMANESPGQTLQPTALVHEAWLRLSGNENARWNGRSHFFAAAAEAMRRILIDKARRKSAEKHGAGAQRVELSDVDAPASTDDTTLLRINDALEIFARDYAEPAELVKLRFFAGLTNEEVAAAMGISEGTAKRHWTFARAWLYTQLNA